MAATLVLVTVSIPGASAHCAVPASVECVYDWVHAAGDGRWCETAKTILGIDVLRCPALWPASAG